MSLSFSEIFIKYGVYETYFSRVTNFWSLLFLHVRFRCLFSSYISFVFSHIKQNNTKQNDIKKLEEQFETDFAVWKREYETTMKLRECERENYIRQQSRAERDRQIESIIAKVDGEALKNQQEFEIKMKYERKVNFVN